MAGGKNEMRLFGIRRVDFSIINTVLAAKVKVCDDKTANRDFSIDRSRC